MKTTRPLLSIGILCLATALAGPAMARSGGGSPDLRRLEHRVEKLDLDGAVRDQAFAILDAAREEDRALRDGLREAHEQLRSLLEGDAPDFAAVEAQVDAIGVLRTRAHKHSLRTALQVGALLTSEQREELVAERHRGGSRGRWLR